MNTDITPFQTNILPGFVGDFLSREHVLAGGVKIDATTFPGEEAVKVTVGANAATDAVLVAVTALSDRIPSGTVLDMGGKKFARLTADAAKNAVSLTVAPLATALVAGDIASYTPPGLPKRVAAGRLVGCTYVELEGAAATGLKWGRAEDADDHVRILAYDIIDVDKNNDGDLLRPGTLIYVNFLPGWAELSNALKTKVRALYECSVGAPGQEVPAS